MRVYIYAIYFPTSKKYYIGITNNLERRMRQHFKSGHLVCRALWKYDNWQIIVLHTCKTYEEAFRIEIEEIRNFNSVAPNGYNLTAGGEGGIHCEETKRKIGDGNRGKKCPFFIERNEKNKGKKRSEISGNKNPAFEIMSSDKNPMKDPKIAKKNAEVRIGKKSPWTTERNLRDNPAKRPEIAKKIGDGNRGKKCSYLTESNKKDNPMNRLDVKIKRLKNRISKLEKEN